MKKIRKIRILDLCLTNFNNRPATLNVTIHRAVVRYVRGVLFGRTGPPILGGRQFWHLLVLLT